MAEKLDQNQMVSFEELMWANTYQTDALAQLLIEKGIITKQEFLMKIKEVQLQYPKYERA